MGALECMCAARFFSREGILITCFLPLGQSNWFSERHYKRNLYRPKLLLQKSRLKKRFQELLEGFDIQNRVFRCALPFKSLKT